MQYKVNGISTKDEFYEEFPLFKGKKRIRFYSAIAPTWRDPKDGMYRKANRFELRNVYVDIGGELIYVFAIKVEPTLISCRMAIVDTIATITGAKLDSLGNLKSLKYSLQEL